MKKFIPYGRQNIDEDDIEAVVRVLKTPLITQGLEVEEFQSCVARYCGAAYAVAFNSGTSALHAAMYAADVGLADEVITSPITFLSSANAAVYMGARPVFVDIDPATYCIDINKLESAITDRTRAIVPVDYAGYPVDIGLIREIANRHNLVIIEDAAHALGSIHQGKMVGKEADMTAFSFHPVKHITTGEGGMVVTDNFDYAKKLQQFRNNGMVRDEGCLKPDPEPWYYEMQDIGYNYRITSFQCALGISQLNKLDSFLEQRQIIARRYDQILQDFNRFMVPPQPDNQSRHAYHLYPLLLPEEVDRRACFEYMRAANIGVQVHYIPVHLQPYYKEHYGYRFGDFPIAEAFYQREISLPIFPGLTEEQQDYVIETLREGARRLTALKKP